MKKPINWNTTIRKTIAWYFSLMMILYIFIDDGGLATKSWKDFIIAPIPAFFFAVIFTLLTCGCIYLGQLVWDRL